MKEYKRENNKRILRALYMLGIMLCVCLCTATFIYAKEQDEKQTVRVGYYPLAGYYEKDEKDILSGYGYEILQMISGYTDITYEYVGEDKSWDELLEMLENGEIDMLTSVQYTEERAEKFEYSTSPIGYSEAVLTAQKGQSRFRSGNYRSYDRMKVGMMKGSALNKKMFKFAKEHHFTFEPVYYGTQVELDKALQEGTEVDAIVNSSMNILKEECVLERFDRAPYYVIVKKGNIKLMDKINYAINKMNTYSPSWMTDLYKKYYAINDSQFYLNAEQRVYLEFLKKKETVLRVIINPDMKPYSYFENGEAKGILVEYFNTVCKLYDLPVYYEETNSAEEYMQAVRKHKTDIVLVPYFLRYEADMDGYQLTQAFLDASFCLITRNGEKPDEDFADKKIAIVTGMTSLEQAAEKNFKNAKIISYSNSEECIDAVKNRKVDGTLLYSYTAYQYLNQDWKNEIKMYEIPDSSATFSIAISKDCDAMLYDLMNCAINMISDNQIQEIVLPAVVASNATEENIFEYILHRPEILYSYIAIVLLLVTIVAIWMNKKYVSHQKVKREKAEYEATHDSLTGAFNRLKLDKVLENPSELAQKIGMLIIDVDYFKDVNDTYGHEMGDQLLQKLVKILHEQFREEDFIIRIGGDEFMILLQNCGISTWKRICEKIAKVHEGIMKELSEDFDVSFSAGLLFSENGISEDMMRKCDVALYHTKKNGRAGCTLVNEKEEVVKYWKDEQADYAYKQMLEQHPLNQWRLIVECDGTRKLYTQVELCDCLELPENALPEVIYKKWFEQLTEEKREKFENMFFDMKKGNTTEMSIHCMHPKKGSISLRFAGRRVSEKDGREVYAGYYQILNGIHVI